MARCTLEVQRCFLALCWSMVLSVGYAYAGLQHVAGVFFFLAVYVFQGKLLQWRAKGFLDDFEGYPRWSYWQSLFNGGLVMPLCVAAAALTHNSANASFLESPVVPGTWSTFWLAQGNAALCAGMLKDFIVYKQEISVNLAVHHVLTVSGTLLSIALPVGNGLAATIAVVAEAGSSCLNLYTIRIRLMPKIVYMVGMATSNGVVVYLSAMLVALSTPIWMRATYVAMCILILYMRTDALWADFRKVV